MSRWPKLLLGVSLLGAAGFLVVPRMLFDRQGWLDDFQQLERQTSEVYANLEWVQHHRKLDLAALHLQTKAALENAQSDSEASIALHAFVERFADPHFEVSRVKLSKRLENAWREWRAPPPTPLSAIPASHSAEQACASLGYEEAPSTFRFRLPEGARVIESDDQIARSFPTAVLSLPSGVRVGLIRIHSFSTSKFGAACREAWTRWKSVGHASCDRACQQDLEHVQIPNVILGGLAARIEGLKDVGLLAVDLTHNGGGTDWVDPATRMLSATALGCPRRAFIKHRHWARKLEGRRDELVPLLQEDGSELSLRLVEQLKRLAAEANEICDRSQVWEGKDPGCALLGKEPLYACGLVERLAVNELAGSPARDGVWGPAGYTFREGVWKGPLAVLVDNYTASASEQLASVLQDAHAAVVVGEKTLGAGCGYTSGGLPIVLAHSGLKVQMPDCARFRANGVNEIEGVEPDVVLAPAQLESGLIEALEKVTSMR